LAFAVLGVLSAALLFSACGRKGPLDPPPGAALQPAPEAQPGASGDQAGAGAQEHGPDGRPLASRGQKKTLPIDWLID